MACRFVAAVVLLLTLGLGSVNSVRDSGDELDDEDDDDDPESLTESWPQTLAPPSWTEAVPWNLLPFHGSALLQFSEGVHATRGHARGDSTKLEEPSDDAAGQDEADDQTAPSGDEDETEEDGAEAQSDDGNDEEAESSSNDNADDDNESSGPEIDDSGEDDGGEDHDEDEDPEEANSRLGLPGKAHGKAKHIFKRVTDGFRDQTRIVEGVETAADYAATKAKAVDMEVSKFTGKMAATGEVLDSLSLATEQYKQEVADYFHTQEGDPHSPLAPHVQDKDFALNAHAIETLRTREVKKVQCKFKAFCCVTGATWSDARVRNPDGCLKKDGHCSTSTKSYTAWSRSKHHTETGEDGDTDADCVPTAASSWFRKTSDWSDRHSIHRLIADLAFVPQAENILAAKLRDLGSPKKVIVQAVCKHKLWVDILEEAGAREELCGEEDTDAEEDVGAEVEELEDMDTQSDGEKSEDDTDAAEEEQQSTDGSSDEETESSEESSANDETSS